MGFEKVWTETGCECVNVSGLVFVIMREMV